MANRITFYGKDYSSIDNEKTLSLTKAYLEDGSPWYLSALEQKNILLRFLEINESKINTLVINGKSKTGYELYSIIGEDKYYFSGVVGVLSSTIHMNRRDIEGDINAPSEDFEIKVTLQIQSRFDVDDNGNSARPFFLATMLMESNPSINNNFILANNDDFLFDFLLLFKFKNQLEEAYHKGYFRTYHRFLNNDDHIKGTIDVSRHIKENMGLNNGKIAYSYRENSVNNYLNHLIVEAYNCLKKKYFSLVNSIFDADFNLKGIITNLIDQIHYPVYDTKTVIIKNLNAISHPFYTEYDELRKICLRILRNEGVSIFDGKGNDDIDGILFYIPDLWEKYLEKFLLSRDYYFLSQSRIKLIDYNDDNNYKQDTYPDYVFFIDREKDKPFMILDAKFKERWGTLVFNRGSFSGLLEDYDKCIRDMNSISAHATGVIFPTNDKRAENPTEYLVHNISKYNKVDHFYTFPIYVPYINGNYHEWLNEFNNNCKNVALQIKKYVIKEKEYRLAVDQLQKDIQKLRK